MPVRHALDTAAGQTMEQVPVGATSRFATPAIYGSLVLVPTLAGLVYDALRRKSSSRVRETVVPSA